MESIVAMYHAAPAHFAATVWPTAKPFSSFAIFPTAT